MRSALPTIQGVIDRRALAFFDDRERFPAGSVEFDSALLMRNVGHRWHAREDLYSW